MSHGHIRVKFSILLSNHVFCYQLSLCTRCAAYCGSAVKCGTVNQRCRGLV